MYNLETQKIILRIFVMEIVSDTSRKAKHKVPIKLFHKNKIYWQKYKKHLNDIIFQKQKLRKFIEITGKIMRNSGTFQRFRYREI